MCMSDPYRGKFVPFCPDCARVILERIETMIDARENRMPPEQEVASSNLAGRTSSFSFK